jgi:hypothetical protein
VTDLPTMAVGLEGFESGLLAAIVMEAEPRLVPEAQAAVAEIARKMADACAQAIQAATEEHGYDRANEIAASLLQEMPWVEAPFRESS